MESTGTPSERGKSRRVRRWPIVLGLFFLLVALVAGYVFSRARSVDDWTRDWVVRALSERFDSKVELAAMHVSAFPEMSATGEDLIIHYHNRTDVAPMFRIQKFTFHLGVLGIFRVPRKIAGVHIDNMVITLPPRGGPAAPPVAANSAPSSPAADGTLTTIPSAPGPAAVAPPRIRKPLPQILIGHIVCDDTSLLILPKVAGKDPLDFEIHDLVLENVGAGRPFSFRGNLTNGKPVGEIATHGEFGPWQTENPGDTSISGNYQFTDAQLGPFPGIGGVLSSTGKYSGLLAKMEVEGETDTPDFSLDPIGHTVPLHTQFSATVDGTNGDTYLHPVRATLLHSLIVANGSVVRVPEKKGHIISLDVVAPKARLEDLLRLSSKSTLPMMTGTVNLKTKFLLPPGKIKVLDKLRLDGRFDVGDARFASPEVREKLQSLSRHAVGDPNNPDAGSAVSDLHGNFHLENGVITFKRLSFSVPGATVLLNGTYTLRGELLAFTGSLRLQAKISQLVTGKKSIFLKAIDPLFSKEGAGTLIPLDISGTRDQPVLEINMFHRKVRKTFGGDSKDTAKKTSGQKPSSNP